MNKKQVLSIMLFVCVCLVALMLVASVQVPIFLTGGSDSLEVVVKTSNFSQWLALVIFLFCWFVCFLMPQLKHKGNLGLKVVLTFITLSIFLMSGHNFKYSGKHHALVDRIFFIPIQTLAINPITYIENGRIEKTMLSINAYSDETKLVSVWLGLPPWNLNENKVESIFHNLGFKKLYK